jgi:putative hydrolase of the HAD superfamily
MVVYYKLQHNFYSKVITLNKQLQGAEQASTFQTKFTRATHTYHIIVYISFMQNIKNIIFDFGNIFINIHFSKTQEAFKNLGVRNYDQLFSQHHASSLFEDLEIGKISPNEFYEGFRFLTETSLSNEQIRDAWNAMLGDYSLEKLNWLDTVKNRYNLFLFSNTNKIHYDFFIPEYARLTGGKNLNDHFIKAYYSHELGLRKPYPESYRAILNEQNLQAAETVFIDDTIGNIEGAKAAGLQTIHLPPPQSVMDLGL